MRILYHLNGKSKSLVCSKRKANLLNGYQDLFGLALESAGASAGGGTAF